MDKFLKKAGWTSVITSFTNDIAWGLIAVIIGLVTIVYSSTIESIFMKNVKDVL